MQIPWRNSTAEELEASTYFLRQALPEIIPPDDFLRLRCTVLKFYPQLVFVEVTDTATEPPQQLYALIDPDAPDIREGVTVLDMTNEPVYRLNPDWLELTEDSIVPYVAFFFSCVAGPYGLMPVIERLDLPANQELDEKTREALNSIKDCVPPEIMSGAAGEDWRVRAALLFQGAVFRAEIEVSASGLVRVDKHELALSAGEPDGEVDDKDGDAGDDAGGAT